MGLVRADPVAFERVVRLRGAGVRALCIERADSVPILAVYRLKNTGEAGSFDARSLAGARILVPDWDLAPVVNGLFASFDPPPALPRLVRSGPHDAVASRVSTHGSLAGAAEVSFATFAGVRSGLFSSLFPHLLLASVLSEAYTSVDGKASPDSRRVTAVALESIVYGEAGLELEENLSYHFRRLADAPRTRELETRFFARLYAAAERAAAAEDSASARKEREMARDGIAAFWVGERASRDWELESPRDVLHGRMRMPLASLRADSSRYSEREVRLGEAHFFSVGSTPPQAWYVHEVAAERNLAFLAPWMRVRDVDLSPALGATRDGREVRAVLGEVAATHEASPAPAVGSLVGTDAWTGELHVTRGGTWYVALWHPPGGYPLLDESLALLARTTRSEEGGRLRHVCVGSEGSLSEWTCARDGGVWDTPCTRDFECPYFSGDARGGCVDGACEMPVGVENVAFRVARGTPTCYDCPSGASGDPLRCCDRQTRPRYHWP